MSTDTGTPCPMKFSLNLSRHSARASGLGRGRSVARLRRAMLQIRSIPARLLNVFWLRRGCCKAAMNRRTPKRTRGERVIGRITPPFPMPTRKPVAIRDRMAAPLPMGSPERRIARWREIRFLVWKTTLNECRLWVRSFSAKRSWPPHSLPADTNSRGRSAKPGQE